jgi:UDPglucose 6-dehydrogenase
LKISVVGSGYVGLVTGGCLAEIGHDVICTDSDLAKIHTLEQGKLPIFEPGLDEVIAKNRRESRLRFESEPAKAVAAAEAIFICVGTPPLPNGDADLSAIDSVARVIAAEARGTKLVVE